MTTTQPSGGKSPRPHQRREDAERHPPRRRVAEKNVEALKLLRRLSGECCTIATEPAAGHDHRHEPRRARRSKTSCALPRIAPAAPRPARSTSTSASSGIVSHAVCVRTPTASPAMRAPATIRRPDAAIVSGSGSARTRRRTKAAARHACAARASASPVTSLSGRSDVNQNNGEAIATSVASAARRSRSASGADRSSASKLRKSTNSGNTDSAPNSALHHDSAPASDGQMACDSLPSAMNTGYPGGCG